MIKAAILGTGNIGSDLLQKCMTRSGNLEIVLFAGIDEQSEGIARARRAGVPVSAGGIEAIVSRPDIRIVFDATSAQAHLRHAPLLRQAGMHAVDMTPAAVGPYCVPAVSPAFAEADADTPVNINMVTCGGQGTIPMVHAVSRVCQVAYAETVSTIASASAGPGTRANIDEFTVTTARAVREVGRAARSKSMIILNPANPPILCQNTIYCELEGDFDRNLVTASIAEAVEAVRQYVPGYRLKHPPMFDGNQATIIVEVEGAGDFLPKYAGNLDIMTSAALAAGERIAGHLSVNEGGGAHV